MGERKIKDDIVRNTNREMNYGSFLFGTSL